LEPEYLKDVVGAVFNRDGLGLHTPIFAATSIIVPN